MGEHWSRTLRARIAHGRRNVRHGHVVENDDPFRAETLFDHDVVRVGRVSASDPDDTLGFERSGSYPRYVGHLHGLAEEDDADLIAEIAEELLRFAVGQESELVGLRGSAGGWTADATSEGHDGGNAHHQGYYHVVSIHPVIIPYLTDFVNCTPHLFG